MSHNSLTRLGYLTKFNTGKLCSEVQPLNLLYIIFAEKVPLLYTFLLKKGSPFTYLLLEVLFSFHVVLNK